MEIVINSLKHNILTMLGNLSSKKVEKLDKILGEYPEKQSPDGSTFIYIQPQDKAVIIAGPNQLGFSKEEFSIANQTEILSNWNKISYDIADAFLLDPECGAFEYDISGIVKAVEKGNKAAANKSISKFSTIHPKALKELGEPVAVGLRFVFSRENKIYDCRVEPLLSSLSNFMLTMNVKASAQGKFSFESTFNYLESDLDFFKQEWFVFIKDSILI